MDKHAENNAKAKLDNIVALTEALSIDFDNVETYRNGVFEMSEDEQQEARKAIELLVSCDLDDADSEEDVRQRIEESALSVEIRSGWESVIFGELEPSEYRILLTTGGPACQIVGELGRYGEPETARIQHQDWGTPWLDLYTNEEQDAALLSFVSVFYFGG
jgi:hypothetical protein